MADHSMKSALEAAERYEAEAEAFYKATGVMAPGKDVSAAMGGYDADELRHKLWRMWARSVYVEREREAMADRILALEAALADARRENDAMAAMVEAAFVEGQSSMHSTYDFAGVEANYEWDHSDAKAALDAHRARAKEKNDSSS